MIWLIFLLIRWSLVEHGLYTDWCKIHRYEKNAISPSDNIWNVKFAINEMFYRNHFLTRRRPGKPRDHLLGDWIWLFACSSLPIWRLTKYIHLNHFTRGSLQISFALPLFIIADERQRKKISVSKNHSRLLQLNALKRFQVLTSACAVISVVACDWENLGVITDYEVVPHLAKLTHKVSR